MSESLFTVHRYEIQVTKLHEPIYLIPIGDVHHDAKLFAREKWRDFLQWARTKQRCYFIGMGDYTDIASGSERRILKNPDLHESTHHTLEDLYRRSAKNFANDLLFSRGRWIGMLEGNHHGVFLNGTTTTQTICSMLNARYLGYCAFIRLTFKYKHKSCSIDIFAHHGRGSSRTAGSSVTNVEKMTEVAEADIFLSGHDHRKWVDYKRRLRLTDGGNGKINLHERKILLGRTGSFLQSYVDGEESYVVKAAMSPTDLGVIKIEMTPKRELGPRGFIDGISRPDRFFVDLHASI